MTDAGRASATEQSGLEVSRDRVVDTVSAHKCLRKQSISIAGCKYDQSFVRKCQTLGPGVHLEGRLDWLNTGPETVMEQTVVH